MSFKPALIVVDMQNDFCPPTGTLAIAGGREITPLINQLIDMPAFALKVGTQDWHPRNHVSFASNHEPPDNKPLESFTDVYNHVGAKPAETMKQRLWPDHCIQGTKGADIIDEIDTTKFDLIVKKGMHQHVEMYSAFEDTFGNVATEFGGVSHHLAQVLKDKGITHVYTVGLAGDYCVKYTAVGAAKAGFTTYMIEEAQRCASPSAWSDLKQEIHKHSVKVITMDSDEVKRLVSVSA